VSALRAPERSIAKNAARLVRVAFSRCALLAVVAGCQPMGTVGVYTDAALRCNPLGASCGAGRACSLRDDPAMDACRDVEGVASGQPCSDVDACEAGSQCVTLSAESARLFASAPGTCARICARDVPDCASGERCVGIMTASASVRIDYGVCGP
jgi:hypothetical protein